jgi:hypothetical protein
VAQDWLTGELWEERVTQLINIPRPGRQAIHDEISTVNDIDDMKLVLRKMLGSIKFHEDDADATGQESLRLSSDAPIDGGAVVRNRTPVIPSNTDPGLYINPSSTADLGPTAGGMINHPLDAPLIAPASVSESGNNQPEITPILRGFPNYAFDATQGATLDAPAYGNMIPNQEILFQVKIGDKIKYGRVALLDNHDEATPRPFTGVAGDTTAEKIDALVQLHNDLVQSLTTMGIFRMVPRENDTLDLTPVGPG